MSKPTALIGYTGFVGSTLARETSFDALFNSSNISDIRGRQFSTVVCAGVSAVKWLANKEPEKDLEAISRLTTHLEEMETDHFVLISTVDVYPSPQDVTEETLPDPGTAQPYGKHRRQLELWAQERFPRCTIVRLPGLFGQGLKKNLIFDLIHGNQTTAISPNGTLQWYPMRRFGADLAAVMQSTVDVINISPEPVSTRDIQETFFPDSQIGPEDMPGPSYDMQTVHASLLDGKGRYHLSRAQVLEELGAFIEKERL